jgi:hypothetical protein
MGVNSMKRFLLSAICIILILALVTGCRNSPSNQVLSVDQLTSQADKYNGKTVTVEGFYFDAFEMEALAGSLGPATYDPKNLTPQGTLIWLKGALPDSVYKQLITSDLSNPTGYPEHYGRVSITGTLATGKFGHMDAYNYQLTITTGSVIPWTPTN